MRTKDRLCSTCSTEFHRERLRSTDILNLPFAQLVTEVDGPQMLKRLHHSIDRMPNVLKRFFVDVDCEHWYLATTLKCSFSWEENPHQLRQSAQGPAEKYGRSLPPYKSPWSANAQKR